MNVPLPGIAPSCREVTAPTAPAAVVARRADRSSRREPSPPSRRWRLLAPVTALLVAASPAAAQEVLNTSYTAPDGTRVLQQQIVVPATLEEVWQAFTTTEGLRSFAAPVARADFRLGGIWEASFDPDAGIGDPDNIRNEYIAFLPLRMLTIQTVDAPPDFPHPELLEHIFFVLELEDLGGGRVRLTESGVGFRDGEGYDAIWDLFERGNAWTFRQLHRRFTEGPVDWSAMMSGRDDGGS